MLATALLPGLACALLLPGPHAARPLALHQQRARRIQLCDTPDAAPASKMTAGELELLSQASRSAKFYVPMCNTADNGGTEASDIWKKIRVAYPGLLKRSDEELLEAFQELRTKVKPTSKSAAPESKGEFSL